MRAGLGFRARAAIGLGLVGLRGINFCGPTHLTHPHI